MLRRSGPIRRKALPRKRSTPRRSGRERDVAYMLWVKTQICCAPDEPGPVGVGCCSGPIHAHHAGKRAAGRKADDDTCISLCSRHHNDWHGAVGPFAGWTREQRREWADARIAETRELWARNREMGAALL
jgi:hypothetical protein